MTEGQFIGWINADVYHFSGAFQTSKKGLNRYPCSDVIFGDLMFVDEDGGEFRPKYHTRPSQFIQKDWENYTANHCTFIKRTVFEEIGSVCEDIEYVMNIGLFWRILKSDFTQVDRPKFMTARRIHESSKIFGETAERNKMEKRYIEEMYTPSTIETLLPNTVLKYLAVGW